MDVQFSQMTGVRVGCSSCFMDLTYLTLASSLVAKFETNLCGFCNQSDKLRIQTHKPLAMFLMVLYTKFLMKVDQTLKIFKHG